MDYEGKLMALLHKYKPNIALMIPFLFEDVIIVKPTSIEFSGVLR